MSFISYIEQEKKSALLWKEVAPSKLQRILH